MAISIRTKTILLNAAILLACIIQFVRGYRPIIVALAALTFLVIGNLTIYLLDSKARALRRQQKRDYYA